MLSTRVFDLMKILIFPYLLHLLYMSEYNTDNREVHDRME